nr:uncharacterized protein LOC109159798 [Ipomoea batatas]
MADAIRTSCWFSEVIREAAQSYGGLGFKRLHEFNLALLAKQGWRLLLYPDSLVGKILKARYYPSFDFMNSQLGNNPSYIWRSITTGKALLSEGLVRRVGDGTNTKIWGWPWLANSTNSALHTPAIEELRDATMSGLLNESGVWDIEVLKDLFLDTDIPRILSTLVSPHVKDTWRWKGDIRGVYSPTKRETKIASNAPPAAVDCISDHHLRLFSIAAEPAAVADQRIRHHRSKARHRRHPPLQPPSPAIKASFTVVRTNRSQPGSPASPPASHLHRPSPVLLEGERKQRRRRKTNFAAETVVVSLRRRIVVGSLSWSGDETANAATNRRPPATLRQAIPTTAKINNKNPLMGETCESFTLNVDNSFNQSKNRACYGGVLRDSEGRWLGGFQGILKARNIVDKDLLAKEAVALNAVWHEISSPSPKVAQAWTEGREGAVCKRRA